MLPLPTLAPLRGQCHLPTRALPMSVAARTLPAGLFATVTAGWGCSLHHRRRRLLQLRPSLGNGSRFLRYRENHSLGKALL